MENSFDTRLFATGLLLTAVLFAGCVDEHRRTPLAPPSTPPPSTPTPPAPPPSVTRITPATSSTGGGASMEIVGTGFQSGVFAIFDDVRLQPRFDPRTVGTAMYLETPPHAAGTIDIIVTNPDGQSARSAGVLTYVAPETFDADGDWVGEALDGSHRFLRFSIQNGRLLRVFCVAVNPPVELVLSGPVSVSGGAFTVLGTPFDGPPASPAVEIMSGRIVTPREMMGTMNFPPCGEMSWRAGKP